VAYPLHLLRLSAFAVLTVLFFAGIWFLRPALLGELGLDLWEWPNWQRELDAECERDGDLSRLWQTALRRERMKDQICLELIDGRLALRDAARHFAELPDPPDRLWEDIRLSFAGAGDEERMCRHVIEWACDLLGRVPARQDALRRRLQEELRNSLKKPQKRYEAQHLFQ
jgi:hypothetical protein